MADASMLVSIVGHETVSGPANTAAGALGTIEGAAGRVGGALGTLAATAAKAALAVGAIAATGFVAGMAASISTATSFEAKLSAISAVSSKTELELAGGMKTLSATALQLGKDTSFSASEAAVGMEELVKAGVSITNVIGGGARAALDLAAAGSVTVAEAATVASNAMNAFGLAGEDMAHIADQLAGASVASATDVRQLGFAIASVGAVAHGIGVSFDDTTTAISLLAQAGLKGADSGTSLKAMLNQLSPQTKSATTEMQKLGIITADGANQFFTAEGAAKDMAQISDVLAKATANLTAEEKVKALVTLFGTDGQRAALILSEQGAAGVEKMTAAQKAAGGAQAIANERLNNLAGSLEKLGGTLDVIKIKFGTPFLPVLKKGVDLLTEALNKNEPAITAFAEHMAAGIDKMIDRVTKAGPAIGAFFRNLGQSVGAVVGIDLDSVAAGWATWGAIAAKVFGTVATAAKTAFTTIKGVFDSLMGSGSPMTQATRAFDDIKAGFATLVPVAIAVGQGIVTNIIETFRFLQERVLPPVLSILQQTGDVLLTTLLPAAQQTGAVLRTILGDSLSWLATTVWPPFLSIVKQTSDFFTGVILPTLPAISSAFRTALGETVQWLATDVWPKLLVAATVAWGYIAGTIVPALPGIAAQIRTLLGGALAWIAKDGWPMFVAGATLAWGFITTKVIPAVTDLISWLKEKLPPAIASVTAAWEALRGKVEPIITAVFEGDIKAALSKLGTAFSEFATLAMGWLGEQAAKIDWASVWSQATDVLASAVVWFADAATRFAGWLGEQVAAINWTEVWNKAVSVVESTAMWFADAGMKFATWLGEQVALIDWAAVWATATEVVLSMAQWFATVAVQFTTWLGEQVATINWATVWTSAINVIESMAALFLTAAALFSTWLSEQVAKIDWVAVWGTVTGMTEAMQTSFSTQAEAIDWKAVLAANANAAMQMATWINETVAAINWAEVGNKTGALAVKMFVEAFTLALKAQVFITAIEAGIIEAISTINVANIIVQLHLLFFGALKGAWDQAVSTFKPALPANWFPGGAAAPGGAPPGERVAPGSGGQGETTPTGDFGPIDNSSRASFVRTAYPYMLQAAGGDKDLAEMMLGAAISENGSVGEGGAFIGNNFFGIKGQGPAGSFNSPTWEMVNGQRVNQNATFAAYENPVQGFQAFMQFLQNNSRYSGALQQYQQGGGAEQLFQGINQAGYATNSGWANSISNIRANQVAPVTANLPSQQTQVPQVPVEAMPPSQRMAPPNIVPLVTPYTSGPRTSTSGIAIHSTRGGARTPEEEYQQTLRYFQSNAPQVSANAVIGPNGEISMLGDWDAAAHHAGENNSSMFGIEMAQARATDPYTDAQYSSLGWLMNEIKQRYGIDINRETVKGHEELAQGQRQGKSDPGPMFDWDRAIASANSLTTVVREIPPALEAAQGSLQTTTQNVSAMGSAATVTTPQLAAIGASIDPIVASFTEGTTSVGTMTDAIILSAAGQGVATASAASYAQGLTTQDVAMRAVLEAFAATTPAAAILLAQMDAGTISTGDAAIAFAGLATTTAVATGALSTMGTEGLANVQAMNLGVVGEFDLMKTGVLTAADLMNTGAVSAADLMRAGVLTEADLMEDGTLTATGLMKAGAVSAAELMNQGVVTEAQVMQAEAIIAADTMYTEFVAAADRMNTETVAAAGTMVTDFGTELDGLGTPIETATGLMEGIGETEIPAPDIDDVLDAMKEVEKAAKKAAEAIKDIGDADKGGSRGGGGSGLGKGGGGGDDEDEDDDEDEEEDDEEDSGEGDRISISALMRRQSANDAMIRATGTVARRVGDMVDILSSAPGLAAIGGNPLTLGYPLEEIAERSAASLVSLVQLSESSNDFLQQISESLEPDDEPVTPAPRPVAPPEEPFDILPPGEPVPGIPSLEPIPGHRLSRDAVMALDALATSGGRFGGNDGGIDYKRLGDEVARALQGNRNNYVLNMTSNAPVSSTLQDYAILEAMGREQR